MTNTTTTTPKPTTNKNTVSKPNGSTSEHPDQPDAASTSPAASDAANPAQVANATKMISISLPSNVHTKLRLLASVTARSISDIATEAVTKVIQAELRAALAKVDLDG
jgi:hypothetical protein